MKARIPIYAMMVFLAVWSSSWYNHFEFPGDKCTTPFQWKSWRFIGFKLYFDNYGGREYWTFGPEHSHEFYYLDGKAGIH